jgi:hypothetical protein
MIWYDKEYHDVPEGLIVGCIEGIAEGWQLGLVLGCMLGTADGCVLGRMEGIMLGCDEGCDEGVMVGSPGASKWIDVVDVVLAVAVCIDAVVSSIWFFTEATFWSSSSSFSDFISGLSEWSLELFIVTEAAAVLKCDIGMLSPSTTAGNLFFPIPPPPLMPPWWYIAATGR